MHDRAHTEADPGPLARRRARRAARAAGPLIALPPLATTGRTVQLSAGAVRVREIGEGPTLLFVHGLLVDGRVWDPLVARLAADHRCVLPDLPLGSHRAAMDSAADLSPEGVAALLEELTEALDLRDVTVVASDSGGAITQLWMDASPARVSQVVLTPCDCFSHFLPPGFRPYQWLAKVPVLARPILAAARLRAVRLLPTVYGGLTHRRIDDALLRDWLAPAQADAGVRVDIMKFLGAVSSDRLTAAADRLGTFDRPVLLAWAPEQAWFPTSHARRLAGILPDARLTLIGETGAFISLDRPAPLADAIRAFVAERAASGAVR